MKKTIILLLLSAISFGSFGQWQVPEYVQNIDQTKPTVYDTDLGGGYRVVETVADRDAIPVAKRRVGAIVSVGTPSIPYIFNSTDSLDVNWLNASNWERVGSPDSYDSIQFNPVSGITYNEGMVYYDSDQSALTYFTNVNGVSMQIGFEGWVRVRNNSGRTILDGEVLYVTGSTGQTPTVDTASNTVGVRIVAVSTHDIPNNTIGIATTDGVVNDINLSMFSDGDELWLSTAGGYRNTKPNGDSAVVFIGVVLRAHPTLGKLLVGIENAGRLADLHDIYDGTPTNGNVLMGNGTYWNSVSLTGSISIVQTNKVYVDGGYSSPFISTGSIQRPFLTLDGLIADWDLLDAGYLDPLDTIQTTTNTSTSITGITDLSNAYIKEGMWITGTGIPYGTFVESKGNEGGNANTLVISNAATDATSGNRIFYKNFDAEVRGNNVITGDIYRLGLNITNYGSITGTNVIMLDVDIEIPLFPYSFKNNSVISLKGSASRIYHESTNASGNTYDHKCSLDFGIISSEGTAEQIYVKRNLNYGQYSIKGKSLKTNGKLGLFFYLNKVKIDIDYQYGLLQGWQIAGMKDFENNGILDCPAAINAYGFYGALYRVTHNGNINGSMGGYGFSPSSTNTFNGDLSGTQFNFPASTVASGTLIFNGNVTYTTFNLTGFSGGTVQYNVTFNEKITSSIIGVGAVFNFRGRTTGVSGNFITSSVYCDFNFYYAPATIGDASMTIMNIGNYSKIHVMIGAHLMNEQVNLVGIDSEMHMHGKWMAATSGYVHHIHQTSTTSKLFIYPSAKIEVTNNRVILKKEGGEVFMYGGILRPQTVGSINPIWCVNNDLASREGFYFLGGGATDLNIFTTPYTGGFNIQNPVISNFTLNANLK